jgi:NAD(P) transhydrogenase subunit alpha
MDTSQSAAQPRPTVGVPRESNEGERRVALVPKIVAALTGKGVDVVVESGAGLGALIPDELYVGAGAKIGDPWSADVIVKVAPPSDEEVGRLHAGQTVIWIHSPRNHDDRKRGE